MPEKPASNATTEAPCAGTFFDVTGRSPFFLDGAENLWVVLDGQIDIFFTPRQGAAQTGPRDALFTAVAGDILFGIDPAVVFDPFAQGSGGANGLIAGGIPGTKALRCTRSEYLSRARADGESLAADFPSGEVCSIKKDDAQACLTEMKRQTCAGQYR